MKVIFVTRGWPTKKDPMMGNYEAVQAKALAKRGVDVTVVNVEYKSLIHFYESGKIKKREEDKKFLKSDKPETTVLTCG